MTAAAAATAGAGSWPGMLPRLDDHDIRDTQLLVLRGCDADRSRHLMLTVRTAEAALDFIRALSEQSLITASGCGRRARQTDAEPRVVVSLGLTFRGLQALQLSPRLLGELRARAPAFCDGAGARAARLGDTGASAAERWAPMFDAERAHLLLSIHAECQQTLCATAAQLRSLHGAFGLDGWDAQWTDAAHLESPYKDGRYRRVRLAHFGFRDGIARPVVLPTPFGTPHAAGELLLGHPNDAQFNRWPRAAAGGAFFRNGSFAAVRQMQQDEPKFREYVRSQAAQHGVEVEYVMAKLCGRWPNGALVKPGQTREPAQPSSATIDAFDFDGHDVRGEGCPFGSHIRRTNPRNGPTGPSRARPLFRRGMPYGDRWQQGETQQKSRGMLGLFFCASLEDQFEHVMGEWVDHRPLGPDDRGTARDPLIGAHDDPADRFHIPRAPEHGGDLMLDGLQAFTITRGMAYVFYPGLSALWAIGQRAVIAFEDSTAAGDTPAGTAGKAPTIERDSAPVDRFCDIVMEGGIASGVAYPWAVVELARHFRFRSIGGTSIGAFAAAITAAAEYRRRQGSIEGFQALAKLPTQLAEERDGSTQLLKLFQPQPGTRRLFALFLASLKGESLASCLLHALQASLAQYRKAVALGALVGAALVLVGPVSLLWRPADGGAWATLLQLVGLYAIPLLIGVGLCAALALAVALARDALRGLVPNGFGLCNGGPTLAWGGSEGPFGGGDERADAPALTRALHDYIQQAAGRSEKEPPLTFADLWSAGGWPPGWPPPRASASPKQERSIDLQVYATNVSHGRPYRFPLDEQDGLGRLFFRPDELAPYFPPPVIKHLLQHARPYRPRSRSDPPAGRHSEGLYELPRAQLPIVVAARLSLAFPLLLSAVPLWTVDYEPPLPSERTLHRCWFADGGLCSNFPIHLFDALLPRWPTFGIALGTRSRLRPEQRVWLPDFHMQGRGDRRDRFDDPPRPPAGRRLAGFLSALLYTTWRWNDAASMRMPGVRDRVVRVLLEPGEGGLDIAMSGAQVLALARYGTEAAEAFRRRFVDSGSGWDEHRWVRFNALVTSLRDRLQTLLRASGGDRWTLPLAAQIDAAERTAPLRERDASALTAGQAADLRYLLGALENLARVFDASTAPPAYQPEPRPVLRQRNPV